jgi:hypothetical protein
MPTASNKIKTAGQTPPFLIDATSTRHGRQELDGKNWTARTGRQGLGSKDVSICRISNIFGNGR